MVKCRMNKKTRRGGLRVRYYGYRRRSRRRNHRGALALVLVLVTLFLVSCVAGSNPLWLRSLFGVDAANYEKEPVEAVLPTDGVRAAELCDMVEILTRGNIELAGFRSTTQAVKLYRDEILNDMLRDHYTLYTGSAPSLSLGGAATGVPVISTFIPAKDFEETVYRYFGGSSVNHADGGVFRYLKDAGGYTAPVQAQQSGVTVTVVSLEETAHTYRMSFTLSRGDETSETYRAVFVKRDDGACYFYSLG